MKYFSALLFTALMINISSSCQTNSNTDSGKKLEAGSFSEKMKTTNNAIVLDVRTPEEFSEGKIEGALNIDYKNNNFSSAVNKLDKSKTYFVYCLAGGRSAAAADQMRSNGFIVYDLKGGIMAWKEAGLKLSSASAPVTDKISMDEFKKMTNDSIPVLVDFYAKWCGPCQKMKPLLEEIQKENQGKAKVVRIDIDENKNLAGELKVSELPVVMVYKKGERTLRHDGFADKAELLKMIK